MCICSCIIKRDMLFQLRLVMYHLYMYALVYIVLFGRFPNYARLVPSIRVNLRMGVIYCHALWDAVLFRSFATCQKARHLRVSSAVSRWVLKNAPQLS